MSKSPMYTFTQLLASLVGIRLMSNKTPPAVRPSCQSPRRQRKENRWAMRKEQTKTANLRWRAAQLAEKFCALPEVACSRTA